MHAVPWFVRLKVYKSLEVCTFQQVNVREKLAMVRTSNWEVVQRAFAPFNSVMYLNDGCSVMYPNDGEQGHY